MKRIDGKEIQRHIALAFLTARFAAASSSPS